MVVLVMVLILAGVVGLGYLDQYRYDAKVPLGIWDGPFSSPTGLRGAMLVVVQRKKLGSGDTLMGASNGVYFRGSVQLCFAARTTQRFTLGGFTDQSGPGFTFYLVPVRRLTAGVRVPDGLHGSRHGDTLAMSGDVIAFTPAGDVLATTNVTRQTRVILAKGDQRHFAGACRRLTAQTK